MATEAERLYITLEARLDRYAQDLGQAQAMTNQRLRQIEGRYASFSNNLKNSTSSAANGVAMAIGGLSAAFGAHAVLEYASEWTRLTRSLEGSEQAFGITLASGKEITAMANDARVSSEAFAKTYIRAAAAVRDYGYTSNDAAKLTSTLAKALKLGSASAEEQASTITQFSQALQKGKLDGDEFRTVMENAGIVQEILAQKLKVTKGEIIAMAQAGKLDIKVLVAAMLEAGGKIDKLYREMPMTVDEAFSVLRNNLVEYLGNADKANGATQMLANGIQAVANNLDMVAVVAGAILSSAAVRMAAFAAASASALNPVTMLAAAVGALAVAYETMGKGMAVSDDGVVQLGDAVSAFFDKINATTELQNLTMQIELLTGAEKEAAIAHKELVEKYAGFAGAYRLALDVVLHYGSALDDLAGGPIKRVIAGVEEMGASIMRATGLMDDARRIALENKALEVRSAGFGGQGFTDYLKDTNRRPVKNAATTKTSKSSFEREIEQIKKRTAALQAEAATVGETAFAQEKAKAAAELRSAAMATAAKEGRKVSAEELAAIEKIANAYADAQTKAAFLAKVQDEKDRTRDLQDEIDLIGLEGEALEKARITQELLNAARKAGVDLTAAQRQEIELLAQRNAQLKETSDRLRRIGADAKEALSSFISDMRSGASATEALGNALDRLADKLIDAGLDTLINSVLGAGTAKSAAGSGGLGALFGFASGGIMVPGKGPASLPRFAKGGVSKTAAIFGEAGAEAAVPLPDGRSIPVDLRMPSIPKAAAPSVSNMVNMPINIDARGATAEGVDKLNKELVPTIRQVVKTEVNQLFDRSNRFARSRL